jgi:hypothetical protein
VTLVGTLGVRVQQVGGPETRYAGVRLVGGLRPPGRRSRNPLGRCPGVTDTGVTARTPSLRSRAAAERIRWRRGPERSPPRNERPGAAALFGPAPGESGIGGRERRQAEPLMP